MTARSVTNFQTLFAGTGTHFTGYLYGDDLADAYATADAFMFTGANETFGQVVQEAMASGLPAIIIDQGGITDQVIPGVNGFICPADPQCSRPPRASYAIIPPSAPRNVDQCPPRRRKTSLGNAIAELEDSLQPKLFRSTKRFDQLFPPDWRTNLSGTGKTTYQETELTHRTENRRPHRP